MARPDSKTQAAAQMIRKRILHGDHALHGIPAERPLAEELGISRQTVRRSLSLLEKEGVLTRHENGRLDVATNHASGTRRPIIGFARDSYPSHDNELWTEGVYAAVEGRNVTVRSMTFEHYGAPQVTAALSGFDALFFLPPAGQIPKWLTDRMHKSKCRVVVLDQDASAAGLPSLVMFPPQAESNLMEHLTELGHRRIDCLNTQARDLIIEGRIASWQNFLKERGLSGSLFSLTEFHPLESAYQLVRNKLRAGAAFGPALLCTTALAALGAMRACHEAGLKIGRDISICTVNDEGLGPYLIPSLTCLRSPLRAVYLRKALDWMLSNREWQGSLVLQPDHVPRFVGESTGPVPH